MGRQYYVYILAKKNDTVLYSGVTNDLVRRIHEHREKLVAGFTKKYNIDKLVYYEIFLVYYEIFEDIEQAILREKQLKGGSREKKIELIERVNPSWNDLYLSL